MDLKKILLKRGYTNMKTLSNTKVKEPLQSYQTSYGNKGKRK